MVASALVLTRVEFPRAYWDLLSLKPWAITLLAVRNAALIAAVMLGMLLLAGGPRGEPRAKTSL
jgi:hypothetical protein